MQSFQVKTESMESFTHQVEDALADRPLGKIVSFDFDDDELVIQFSKLGKSVVRYRVEQNGDTFTATPIDEKIALAHRAFKGDIEDKIEKLLSRLGAQVI